MRAAEGRERRRAGPPVVPIPPVQVAPVLVTGLLAVLALSTISCAGSPAAPAAPAPGSALAGPGAPDAAEVHRRLLPLPAAPDRRVELLWVDPADLLDPDVQAASAPRAALLLVHGHQSGERPGAASYAESGLLHRLADEGFVAAAVSQPGYGASDGPPDFCGPVSQAAVRAAVAALRALPGVDPERIVLYGHSRGAITSSMVALDDPRLAAVVLSGGIYDLAAARAAYPEDAGIRRNLEREAGVTREAFRARSPLLAERTSSVPTLLLHGARDEIAPPDDARRLAERLEAAGTPVELVLFPDHAHRLPWTDTRPIVLRFLERYAHASLGRS